MDVLTTKEELLGIIQAEHSAWLALLAAIGEDRMLPLGAAGPDWTVKDSIAHLTAWRGRTVARLEAGMRHTEPAPRPWPAELDENAESGVERINTWFYDADRERPLVVVLRESEETWQRMEDMVRALPDADLLEAGRFDWLDGAALAQVVNWSLEHLHEHVLLLAIQGWQTARRRAD